MNHTHGRPHSLEWLVNIKQTPGKRRKRGKEEWREGGLSGEEDLGGVGEEENMINNNIE